jgi:hypothetical protein
LGEASGETKIGISACPSTANVTGSEAMSGVKIIVVDSAAIAGDMTLVSIEPTVAMARPALRKSSIFVFGQDVSQEDGSAAMGDLI